ncbi:MAG: putative porin [Planctomycetota bacterium]
MKQLSLISLAFLLILLSTPDQAQGRENSNALSRLSAGDVQAEIDSLLKRVEELEKSKLPDWVSKFTFKGDLRYRYEMYNTENDTNSRVNRNRIRARLFIGAEVNDHVDVGIQVASGTDDPVSSNQTLGNGWTSKDLWIDLAYFDWHPLGTQGSWGIHVVGGKMKTPFRVMSKSELIWDPDLRPEGIAVAFTGDMDSVSVFGSAGGFYVQEKHGKTHGNTTKTEDVGLFGAQLGLIVPAGDTELTFGAGLYDYGNVKGAAALYDDDASGNLSTVVNGTTILLEDYNLMEYFAEIALKAGDLPVALFGNYVNNLAATREDKGYLGGVKIGKTKKPNTWDVRYQYKRLERDAALGAFTDSDFGGGGTNTKGHELNVNYMLAENWKLGLTYFMNTKHLDDVHRADRDYERFQFDLNFVF